MSEKYIWIVVPIILIVGVWIVFVRNTTTEPGSGRIGAAKVAVETDFIQRMDLTETASFSGTILPRSSYQVATKISGQLRRLHVDVAQRVSKNEILAELDDRLILRELERAEAAVEVARATKNQSEHVLAMAVEDLQRYSTLFEQNYVSQAELNEAQTRYRNERMRDEIASANLRSAIAAYNSAELQLSFTKIRAEWEGDAGHRVIGERFVDEGSQVSAGSPLFSLMDLEHVIVRINVIERDYNRLRPGQSARISVDSFAGETFEGKVLRVAPLLSESTRQAAVEIQIPNPNYLLKPGMFARVEIDYQSVDDVSAVPQKAMAKRDGRDGLWLVEPENRAARFVEVDFGIHSKDYVQIMDPDLEGEVVTLGHDLLQDGRIVSEIELSEEGSR
mgnify:CR=1 FL=1